MPDNRNYARETYELVPREHRVTVAAAMLLSAVAEQGEHALVDLMKYLGFTVSEAPQVATIVRGLIVALTSGVAQALPDNDDSAMPHELLAELAGDLENEEAQEHFENVRTAFHAAKASFDIRRDLDAITQDPDKLGGLL